MQRLAAVAHHLEATIAASSQPAPAKVGGAVLLTPAAPVPAELRAQSEVEASGDYAPFTKTLSSCGLRLIALPDVADTFIAHVGRAAAAMLAPGPGIDAELQDAVITAMHAHRACCPMWKGMDAPPEVEDDPSSGWEQTEAQNSVCDVIIYSVGGQTMEVIEHILHHVTDVGFHFAFPADWGLNETSTLHAVMTEAIQKGFYDVEGYEEMLGTDDHNRVLLQEFGYWIITTAWNIQRRWGPFDAETGEPHAEWTLVDRAALEEHLPSALKLLAETSDRVLVPPTATMLEELDTYGGTLGSSQPGMGDREPGAGSAQPTTDDDQ